MNPDIEVWHIPTDVQIARAKYGNRLPRLDEIEADENWPPERSTVGPHERWRDW